MVLHDQPSVLNFRERCSGTSHSQESRNAVQNTTYGSRDASLSTTTQRYVFCFECGEPRQPARQLTCDVAIAQCTPAHTDTPPSRFPHIQLFIYIVVRGYDINSSNWQQKPIITYCCVCKCLNLLHIMSVTVTYNTPTSVFIVATF